MGAANQPRNKGKSLIAFPADCVVIDIETTGLDAQFDEIIELSAIKVRNGRPTEQFSTLVRPQYDVPEFITELTGITNSAVKDAPLIHDVLPAYMTFMGDEVVVGHNVNFDINFLYDKYLALTAKEFSNDFVDTLRLARFLLRDIYHHRLIDLVKYYRLGEDVEHRGLADAAAASNILIQLQHTAVVQYGTVEQFGEDVRRRLNHPHPSLSASSITTDRTDFDIANPLYGQHCVFTGALERMLRKEAFQMVVDCGGLVQDNVTKDTNYLILGSLEYSRNIKDGKSAKLKKAESLVLKGSDLTILSENVFYDMAEPQT
ncbi:MAG TPA: exonuclease domain-containing protein [Candidatus Saccharimonadales bacterium]